MFVVYCFVVCIWFLCLFLYYYNALSWVYFQVLQKRKDNIYFDGQKCKLTMKPQIYIIIIFNILAKQTRYNHIFKPLHNTPSNYNNINSVNKNLFQKNLRSPKFY